MRLRTVIIGIAVLLVLAAGGALWWLYASRDALIKRAIEHYGPELTGGKVSVKSVRLEPVDGRGAISGVALGNPPGFTSPHAMTLGEVRLAVDPGTLTSAVVHVREISLEAPSITYERGAQGDNLSAIQKHIESRLPKSKGGTGAQDASPPRKFIIDHVRVRNAKVNYGGVATVDMPDIQLRDLGKKSNGATAAEITKEIWTELTRVAISRAPAALEGLRDKAKDAAERLRGLAK
ncbi:MAG TPA: hypothetical protein VEQ87_04790 [Burkholderiales bacterium]|nr:hypothetical protein [Burkholderiales bacterium]